MLLRHPDTTYNLKTGSLAEALTRFFPGLLTLNTVSPEYLERCAQCFLKGLCEQCPGQSWMEHGTLDTPSNYLCEVAHAEAIHLGLLKPGEAAWQVFDWQDRLARLTAWRDF